MQEPPLWIKEILKNDINKETFHLIDKEHFAIVKHHSKKISFDSLPVLRKKMRVAFFRDGPFLPISTGAASSIYGMMNALVENEVEVYLLYCYRGWSNYDLYKDQKFSTVFINKDDFYTNSKLISRILKGLNIQICHFDSAEAVSIQKKILPPNCKVVFEVHNIENELMKQLGSSQEEVEEMRRKEIKAVSLSDVVIVRSRENYCSVKNFRCNKPPIFIYRGGIDSQSIIFERRNNLRKNVVVFLGHLNYEPNRQAVEIIAKKIVPNVKKDLKYFIGGKGSPELKLKFNSERIEFLGQIPNLNDLFSKVDIALAPIISGSGTRLKILDYMAAGIPVIGTTLSIEGLEPQINKCMIVEDNFNRYPQIILNLYKNPEKVNELSSKGREFVEKYRDWNVCIKDVINAYIFIMDNIN